MRTFSASEQELLLSIARPIVVRLAWYESEFFHELAAEYLLHPVPPEVPTEPSDDPLAAGLEDFLAPATPAALAMTIVALDYVREQVAVEAPGDTLSLRGVGSILARPPRNQELRERLQQTGREYCLSATMAKQMSDELLAALLSLDAEATPQRTINAWIEGVVPDQPLAAGQTYGLCFNVAPPRHDSIASGPTMDDYVALLPPEQEQVAVSVLLRSDSVDLHGPHQQTLLVPRSESSEQVQFTISPRRSGACRIDAFFFIDSQLFHQMKLELTIGAPDGSDGLRFQVTGRAVEAAIRQLPRRKTVSLLISKRESGYDMILMSETGVKRALIRISEAEIDDMLRRARRTLQRIVHTSDSAGRLIYQQRDTAIPQEYARQAIQQLAEVGSYLYSKLFYGRDDDARAIGDLLRELMQVQQFYIDIIAEHFIFPWTLLYTGEDPMAPDLSYFWGFQHFVAYMPQFAQTTAKQLEPQIAIETQLQLEFVCNQLIDKHQQVVSRQRQFFQTLSRVQVREHADAQSLFEMLNQRSPESHVIYFYCHAESRLPGDLGGVSSSRLILTDGPVELYDLEVHASTRKPPLGNAPLVFLNACESAELSPYLYDGLLPYLIKRGARGVIGTEVDTPIYFAAEFAQRLFARWMTGTATLGEVVLDLRRTYLQERNNVLGLLYSLYVGSDLALVWNDASDIALA